MVDHLREKGPRSARSATRSSSIPREDAPVANLIARTPFDGHLPLSTERSRPSRSSSAPSPPSRPFAGQAEAVSKALEKAVGCALPPSARSFESGRRASPGAGWTSGSSWPGARHGPRRGADRPKRRLGRGRVGRRSRDVLLAARAHRPAPARVRGRPCRAHDAGAHVLPLLTGGGGSLHHPLSSVPWRRARPIDLLTAPCAWSPHGGAV
jgi:hypothetical protein